MSCLTGQDSLVLYAENEFAELLRALEHTLSKLKATKEPAQRRSFRRKMRRFLGEIDRISNGPSELGPPNRSCRIQPHDYDSLIVYWCLSYAKNRWFPRR
jgi:hypothetical protein